MSSPERAPTPSSAAAALGLLFERGFEAAFVVARPSRIVLAVNPRCQDVLGVSEEQVAGCPVAGLIADDPASARDASIVEQPGHYEDVAMIRGDGYALYVELTISHLEHPALGPIALCVARDTTERRELERELLAKHAALYAAHAELERLVHALRATQRELEARNEEIAALAGQVARVGWRAAVAELAADVAHHLNNPVAALSSTLRTLELRLDAGTSPPRELTALIQRARGAASRIEDHVAAVVRVQRAGSLDAAPRRLDLAGELDMALTMFGKRPQVVVRASYPRPMEAIAPQDPLHHVLAATFDQAAAALPRGGAVEVAAERHAEAWVIQVAHAGGRLEPVQITRMFEPVAGERPAAGLALATAQRLARAWGGDLRYQPRADGGCFEISLPFEVCR